MSEEINRPETFDECITEQTVEIQNNEENNSNWLDKAFSISRKIFTSVCCVFLAIQVIIVFYVVIGRYVFSKTPGWGETSALFCMVWFCLISSALPLLDDSHLKVTLIEHILPQKAVEVLDFINLILSFAFGVFLIIYGIKMYQLGKLSILTGLGVKSSWLYLSVPIAGVSICMAALERMVFVCRAHQ